MKKTLIWLLMFQKRLLRHAGFLVLLLLIPVLVVLMTLSAKKDDSLLTIGLLAQTPRDATATAVIDSLTTGESILEFRVYDREKDLRDAVERGIVDGAWIFPNDLQKRIEKYVESGFVGKLVTVVEQEDSVPLQLSHEKLYGALFPSISKHLYRTFIRDGLLTEQQASDRLLEEYYSGVLDLGSLVKSEHLNGASIRQENYLLIPLRGMLALLILLCGFAGMMYHMQDVRAGVYDWLPERDRLLPAIGNVFAATADAAVATLIALACAGLCRTFWEIPAMILLVFCATAFCLLVGNACRKETVLGAIVPILLLAMLVICPIFLNFEMLFPLQILCPPYYYLYALSDLRYLLFMLAYIAVGFSAVFGINTLCNKNK